MHKALKIRAQQLYNELSDNDKAVIRFGMIPAATAAQLETEFPDVDVASLALALMDCTKSDGGMIV